MATPYVLLNSIQLTPTKKSKATEKIGKVKVNARGGRTWVQRVDGSNNPVHKRKWEMEFENVVEAKRAQVENLFLLSSQITFVDENGNSYTVQCEADEYSDEFTHRSGSGILYYTVKITIHEA